MPGSMRVKDVVGYAAWLKQVRRHDIPLLVQRALHLVDMGSRSDDRVRALSGGMRRRLCLACAIVHRPRVLLLDEPMAGLDPQQRIGLRGVLRELASECTVFISTHQLSDVPLLEGRLVVLDAGRVVFDGTPTALAELGADGEAGDSPIERGFIGLVRTSAQ